MHGLQKAMKILSFGAGTQSTALALMACDNADMNKPVLHTAVPIYDAVIFCDLGLEPPWVMQQVEFTRRACEAVGIPFYVWTRLCTGTLWRTSVSAARSASLGGR